VQAAVEHDGAAAVLDDDARTPNFLTSAQGQHRHFVRVLALGYARRIGSFGPIRSRPLPAKERRRKFHFFPAPSLLRHFLGNQINTWLLFVGKRWVDEAARRLFSAILKTKAGLNDIGSRFYFGEGA
jgi:hypothetical protein